MREIAVVERHNFHLPCKYLKCLLLNFEDALGSHSLLLHPRFVIYVFIDLTLKLLPLDFFIS